MICDKCTGLYLHLYTCFDDFFLGTSRTMLFFFLWKKNTIIAKPFNVSIFVRWWMGTNIQVLGNKLSQIP